MSDIRTKPVTPEYEESWERVFGKKDDSRNMLGYQLKKTLDIHFKHLQSYSFTDK